MDSSTATEATEAELAFQRAEFMAEDELIEINPMVKSDVITLMRGEFGPFEPSISSSVSFQYMRTELVRCGMLPARARRWLTLCTHIFLSS